MEEILKYELKGINEPITRVKFGERIVEFWGGGKKTDKLLIAHDGQCIFDSRVAKNNNTWKLAENASLVAEDLNVTKPLIIAIWHRGNVGDSVSRGIDLSPEDYFKSGIQLFPKNGPFDLNAIQGNKYLQEIFELIVPKVLKMTNSVVIPKRTAMIGASRGALCTLYALSRYPQHFYTAIAHSTHWPIGGNSLVKLTIDDLPTPNEHRIWMSHGTLGFDAEYEPFQNYANDLLKQKGYERDVDYFFTLYPQFGHTESDWAKQAGDSLRNWFQKID